MKKSRGKTTKKTASASSMALIFCILFLTLFLTGAAAVFGGEDIKLENPDDPSAYTQMTAADFNSCTNCKFETFLQSNPSQAEAYLSSNYNAEEAAVYFRQQQPITGNNKEIFKRYLSGEESGTSSFQGQNLGHARAYLTQPLFDSGYTAEDRKIAAKYCTSVSAGSSGGACNLDNAGSVMVFPAQGAEPERIVVSPGAGASVTVLSNGKEMQYAGGELGGNIVIAGDTLELNKGTLSQDGKVYTTTETLKVTFDAQGNPKKVSGSGWKIQDTRFTKGREGAYIGSKESGTASFDVSMDGHNPVITGAKNIELSMPLNNEKSFKATGNFDRISFGENGLEKLSMSDAKSRAFLTAGNTAYMYSPAADKPMDVILGGEEKEAITRALEMINKNNNPSSQAEFISKKVKDSSLVIPPYLFGKGSIESNTKDKEGISVTLHDDNTFGYLWTGSSGEAPAVDIRLLKIPEPGTFATVNMGKQVDLEVKDNGRTYVKTKGEKAAVGSITVETEPNSKKVKMSGREDGSLFVVDMRLNGGAGKSIKQAPLSTGEYIYELANHKGEFPDLEGNVEKPGTEKDESAIREEYFKLSNTDPSTKESPPISESEAVNLLNVPTKEMITRIGNKYTTIFEESKLNDAAKKYPEGRKAFYRKADSNGDGVIDKEEAEKMLDQ